MAYRRAGIQTMRLQVLLVTNRNERAALIEQALVRARHAVVARIQPDDDLGLYVREARPDALVIEAETPDAGILQQLQQMLFDRPLPVAMFVDRSDKASLQTAMKAGVGAFVIDGFQPSRVVAVLEAARARFGEFQALRRERDRAVTRLTERKAMERTKGLLTRRRQLAEDEG